MKQDTSYKPNATPSPSLLRKLDRKEKRGLQQKQRRGQLSLLKAMSAGRVRGGHSFH
ncbi:MAG: hypothetical protein HYZ01_13740 [Ignavibacteriales bacterium]|nr:hypothetical protein [Ignavibacteriales bacterium]